MFSQNPFITPYLYIVLIPAILCFTAIIGEFIWHAHKEEQRKKSLMRIASWFVISYILLISAFAGKDISFMLLVVVVGIALLEIRTMSNQTITYFVASVFCAASTLGVGVYFNQYMGSVLLLYGIVASVCMLTDQTEKRFHNAGVFLFSMIWIPFTLVYFIFIVNQAQGLEILLLVYYIATWSDIVPFYFAKACSKYKWFNTRKIAPHINKEKTYVGALGNIIGAVLAAAVILALLPNLKIKAPFFLALLLGIVGSLGDLIGSMVKRSFGYKESGSLFPGMGGIIDRIDSSTLIVVVMYYWIVLF